MQTYLLLAYTLRNIAASSHNFYNSRRSLASDILCVFVATGITRSVIIAS